MSGRIAKYIDFFTPKAGEEMDISIFRSYLDKIKDTSIATNDAYGKVNQAVAKNLNATLEPFSKDKEGLLGYARLGKGVYSYNPKEVNPQRTITHELSHLAFPEQKSQGKFLNEIQAEGNAYAVGHLLGADPDSNAMTAAMHLWGVVPKDFSKEQVGNYLDQSKASITRMAKRFVQDPESLSEYAFKSESQLDAERLQRTLKEFSQYNEADQEEIRRFAKGFSGEKDVNQYLGIGAYSWKEAKKTMDEFSRLDPLKQSHVSNYITQLDGKIPDINLYNIKTIKEKWGYRKDAPTTYNPDFNP